MDFYFDDLDGERVRVKTVPNGKRKIMGPTNKNSAMKLQMYGV